MVTGENARRSRRYDHGFVGRKETQRNPDLVILGGQTKRPSIQRIDQHPAQARSRENKEMTTLHGGHCALFRMGWQPSGPRLSTSHGNVIRVTAPSESLVVFMPKLMGVTHGSRLRCTR
jgi:hypothetical protein